jgi:hypothetical protein
VWKVEPVGTDGPARAASLLRVRHAKRGSREETMTLEAFCARCAPYFAGQGRMIDQAYQERLPEGMVRCYLVHDTIAGFGHQAINALFPAPPGAPPGKAPQPGPRLYHPPTESAFQALKRKVEQEWVPEMQQLLDIPKARLPVLWDCDFLLGPRRPSGEDTYVLCEINVSSVAPYPERRRHTSRRRPLPGCRKRFAGAVQRAHESKDGHRRVTGIPGDCCSRAQKTRVRPRHPRADRRRRRPPPGAHGFPLWSRYAFGLPSGDAPRCAGNR